MEKLLIIGIGFLAQGLFFARFIVQWFKSESAGKVLSPVFFWYISLVGSIFMLIYGIFREDAAILIGQLAVYFIYVRNLALKKVWSSIPPLLKIFILITPAVILIYLFYGTSYSLNTFLKNDKNPLLLMLWGIIAQLVFISRFFYQWIYSETHKESLLPLGFWIISICGAVMNFIYGIFRLDPVLIASHALGSFVYLRNILILNQKESLFDRIKIPTINKFVTRISNKIK